jgi:hypothetical protein
MIRSGSHLSLFLNMSRFTKVRKIAPDHEFRDRCLVCFTSFLTVQGLEQIMEYLSPLPKEYQREIFGYLVPESYWPYCSPDCYQQDSERFHRCISCFQNLTSYNPRQYCGKQCCSQPYAFSSDPEQIQRFLSSRF